MATDPLGIMFAFTAGVFALFSPCGFPMLPGYMLYYMGAEAPLERAVKSGFACVLGLLTMFSFIGALASVLGGLISKYITFLELFAGIVTLIMGFIVLFNVKIPYLFLSLRAPRQRGFIGLFLYGSIYGLATLGCSAPVFFSILFYAIAIGGPLYSIFLFITYALGMGTPLILITIFVSKAKDYILNRMMDAMPFLQKLSGIALIVIGSYLILYYFTLLYPSLV